MAELTGKQEKFCRAIVLNGGDKVEAYLQAGYSAKQSKATLGVSADRLFNTPKINLRINALRKLSEKRFTITVEKRLKWLEEIVQAGLGTYQDSNGSPRREGLAAARSAIDTMNGMLGDTEGSNIGEPVAINISVREPVGNITVTKPV